MGTPFSHEMGCIFLYRKPAGRKLLQSPHRRCSGMRADCHAATLLARTRKCRWLCHSERPKGASKNPSFLRVASLVQREVDSPFGEDGGIGMYRLGTIPQSACSADSSCCGARHLRCRRSGFIICRPLPLAQLAVSAPGGARIAPPFTQGGLWGADCHAPALWGIKYGRAAFATRPCS